MILTNKQLLQKKVKRLIQIAASYEFPNETDLIKALILSMPQKS